MTDLGNPENGCGLEKVDMNEVRLIAVQDIIDMDSDNWIKSLEVLVNLPAGRDRFSEACVVAILNENSKPIEQREFDSDVFLSACVTAGMLTVNELIEVEQLQEKQERIAVLPGRIRKRVGSINHN